MKSFLVPLALAALLAAPAVAGDSRGIVTYTGSDASVPPFYLDCVNETVSVAATYEARFHQFTTASGTTHVLDNWRYTTLYTGLTSGRQWIGSGVSPLHANTRVIPGVTYGFTSASRMVLLGGGPNPAFVFTNNYKLTINALGEVVVQIVPVPGEPYVCLGPKG